MCCHCRCLFLWIFLEWVVDNQEGIAWSVKDVHVLLVSIDSLSVLIAPEQNLHEGSSSLFRSTLSCWFSFPVLWSTHTPSLCSWVRHHIAGLGFFPCIKFLIWNWNVTVKIHLFVFKINRWYWKRKQKSFVAATCIQESVSYKSMKLFSTFKNGHLRLEDQNGNLENNAIP